MHDRAPLARDLTVLDFEAAFDFVSRDAIRRFTATGSLPLRIYLLTLSGSTPGLISHASTLPPKQTALLVNTEEGRLTMMKITELLLDGSAARQQGAEAGRSSKAEPPVPGLKPQPKRRCDVVVHAYEAWVQAPHPAGRTDTSAAASVAGALDSLQIVLHTRIGTHRTMLLANAAMRTVEPCSFDAAEVLDLLRCSYTTGPAPQGFARSRMH